MRRDAVTVPLLSLSEDVLVEEDARAGTLTLVTRWGEQTVRDPDRLVIDSLRRLALGPVSLRNVQSGALDRVLDRLSGSVVHSLGGPDGQPLLSASPLAPRPVFDRPDVPVLAAHRELTAHQVALVIVALGCG